ncbi:hypothetical protein RFI_08885, partial [Reticulomyxa filosa]
MSYSNIWAVFLSLALACDIGKSQVSGDHITVHIVAHTHDDVGTFVLLFFLPTQSVKKQKNYENSGDPFHKFTYVEQAYFSRWWNEQSDGMKEKVRALVASGQLQFNLGGWAMNDEVDIEKGSIFMSFAMKSLKISKQLHNTYIYICTSTY